MKDQLWVGVLRNLVIVLPQKTKKILAKTLKLFHNSGKYQNRTNWKQSMKEKLLTLVAQEYP